MSSLMKSVVWSAVTVAGVCGVVLPVACSMMNLESFGLANPASENCILNGGSVEIREGPAGQFGVCVFPDGFEAEEWAMFRGEVPVGGVDVSGLVTQAAEFCAITGGTYTATAEIGTADEVGTCTFENGQVCDATQYYEGTCSPTE